MRSRVRHLRDDSAGFSLIELLIAMSIFSVFISLAFGLLITTQKQVASAGTRLDDIDQARMSMDVMSRSLRTAVEPAQLEVACVTCASIATAIYSAQDNTIALYSNTDSLAGPNKVSITAAYDAALGKVTLIKTSQPPDVGSAPNYAWTACTPGPSCSKTSVILARGVRLGATPLFTYYDSTGTVLPTVSGAVAATDLIKIDAIAINLTVTSSGNAPTTVIARLGLPNSGTGVLPTTAPTP